MIYNVYDKITEFIQLNIEGYMLYNCVEKYKKQKWS